MTLGRTTLRANGLVFDALTVGEPDRPLVVCVHGFPDSHRTFGALLPALAAAGYRAVAPAIRGYGAGSRPADGVYAVTRLADDVVGWLDALGARSAHVVGHDWGAVMGYAAAARAPERVRSLVAMAIPPLARLPEVLLTRPRALARLDYMALFQARGLAERLLTARGGALVDALWRRWSPGYTLAAAERAALTEVLGTAAGARAALAYYRDLFALWREESRRSVALLRRPPATPTLVLHGARDGCMAAELFAPSAARAKAASALEVMLVVEELRDAGHFLHLERPEQVNARVIAWLAANA